MALRAYKVFSHQSPGNIGDIKGNMLLLMPQVAEAAGGKKVRLYFLFLDAAII